MWHIDCDRSIVIAGLPAGAEPPADALQWADPSGRPTRAVRLPVDGSLDEPNLRRMLQRQDRTGGLLGVRFDIRAWRWRATRWKAWAEARHARWRGSSLRCEIDGWLRPTVSILHAAEDRELYVTRTVRLCRAIASIEVAPPRQGAAA